MKSAVFSLICLLLLSDRVVADGDAPGPRVVTQGLPAKQFENVLKTIQGINDPLKCTISKEMEYVCDDMAKLSCKDGTFVDGTGKTLSEGDYQKKIAPIRIKVEAVYQDAIEKMIGNSKAENQILRNLAIKAANQHDTADCLSSTLKDRKTCNHRVAEILGRKEAAKQFSIEEGKSRKASIDFEALEELTDLRSYTNGMAKANREAFEIVSEKKLNKKIKDKIFPRVKALLLKKIDVLVTDEKVRKRLKEKISGIVYSGNDCMGLVRSKDPGSLEGMVVNNAVYYDGSINFRFCNGYLLKNSSEFMIASVIGHELSHAIDPCNIVKPRSLGGFEYRDLKVNDPIENAERQNPFHAVVSCLRTEESVGAIRAPAPNSDLINLAEAKKSAPFCYGDQITESFSDWMSSEVLPEYIDRYHPKLSETELINGYANAGRSSCSVVEDSDFDVHPNTSARINRIRIANPMIRKQLGCGAPKDNLHYCEAGKVFEGHRAKSAKAPIPSKKEGEKK